MKLSKEEYQLVQDAIQLMAGLVRELPLRDFIADAVYADSVGSILDPTLYHAATGKLDIVVKHAVALRVFQSAVGGSR